MLKKAEDKIG